MRKEDFFEVLGELDDDIVKGAKTHMKENTNNKVRRPTWVKWGAVAACLMLIVGAIFWNPTTHDGRRVISEYHTNSSGSYATPSPGEVKFTSEVREARKKYDGKNVTFLLAFSIFKDNGEQIIGLSEEGHIEEYQRLISLGYELYMAEYWTYQGKDEKEHRTIVVGYFTESDLSLFRGNPEYGYMFYFATNGDGSGISVNESDIITSFQTNYQ